MAVPEEVDGRTVSLMGDGGQGAGLSCLVPMINTLREALSVIKDEPFSLPTITVVGSQSSGKSSVLEGVVGHSFLPRGNGIVTRCPCVIRMHQDQSVAFAQFPESPSPERHFTDFTEVRTMIERETLRLAGERGLSEKAIVIDIFSSDLIDLTVVDLPGAVRTVADGQDPQIIRQIDRMIMSYISQPNCIILAVSAANTDLANSDAIAYSRKVDPEGERTLAVLTKLDLMDEGTDARGILTGEDEHMPKLKLGYIGVVNRSQADINAGRGIQDSRRKEMMFFKNSPIYTSIAMRQGTQYLVERCSQLLVQTIQREIPKIDAKVNTLIARKRTELRNLPEVSQENMRILYHQVIRDFENSFGGLIDGDSQFMDVGKSTHDELEGGARVAHLFDSIFYQEIMALTVQNLDSMDRENFRRLRNMIKNQKGICGGLNVPNGAFQTLVRWQVDLTEQPILRCCMLVLKEMQCMQLKALESIPLLESFPNARTSLIQTSNEVLTRQHNTAVEHLKMLVEMNKRHLSYNHPDFDAEGILHEVHCRVARMEFGTEDTAEEQELLKKAHRNQPLTSEEKARVRSILERRRAPPPIPAAPEAPAIGLLGSVETAMAFGLPKTSITRGNSVDIRLADEADFQERLEIENILGLTRGYFQIVQKQIVDMVPKYIELLLVHKSRTLIFEKVQSLTDAQVAELMSPSSDVKLRRQDAEFALKKLIEAQEILYRVSRSGMHAL